MSPKRQRHTPARKKTFLVEGSEKSLSRGTGAPTKMPQADASEKNGSHLACSDGG